MGPASDEPEESSDQPPINEAAPPAFPVDPSERTEVEGKLLGSGFKMMSREPLETMMLWAVGALFALGGFGGAVGLLADDKSWWKAAITLVVGLGLGVGCYKLGRDRQPSSNSN